MATQVYSRRAQGAEDSTAGTELVGGQKGRREDRYLIMGRRWIGPREVSSTSPCRCCPFFGLRRGTCYQARQETIVPSLIRLKVHTRSGAPEWECDVGPALFSCFKRWVDVWLPGVMILVFFLG
jgi:hypothetical protein